jgi:ubiquinone/menaquinone biosynthesis C-methylase UbiE
LQEWDSSARDYDLFEKRWHHYRNVAQGLLNFLPLQKDSSILELACGTGACTELLSRLCSRGEIVAVDRSSGMIVAALDNIRSSEVTNVEFIVADASILPLKQADKNNLSFDLAISNSAFWQFDNALKVLQDLRILLREDGQFGFSMPLWFSSEDARDQFRREVQEIYSKYGVVPNSGRSSRQRFNYRELLEKTAFTVIREENYEVKMSADARREWRAIPVFQRSFDRRPEVTENLSAKMRQELQEARRRAFPEDSGKVRWRAIVAVPNKKS